MNDLSRVLLDAIIFLAIMPFVLPRLSGWLASHFALVLLFSCCFCFAHSLNMVQPGAKKESKASVSRKKRKAQEKSRRRDQRRKAERKKETPEERELRLSKRRIIGPAGCNLGNLWTGCLFVCLLGAHPPFDKSHAGCSMNCTCELLKTCFFLSNLGCKLELSCFGFVFSLISCVAPVGVVFVTIFSLHSGARMRGTSKLS